MMDVLIETLRISPRLCSTDMQLLMLEKYEIKYGICDHNVSGNTRPLLLQAMHPTEDATTNSLLELRIEQFAELRIGRHFNISLNEFFNLPRDVVLKMISVANKMQKIEGSVASDLLSNLDV